MKSGFKLYLTILLLLTPLHPSTANGIAVLKNTEGTLSVEVESNGNADSANPIYSGINVVGNYKKGDIDYFSFVLSEPSLMTLNTKRLDDEIDIIAPDGTYIFSENYVNNKSFSIAGVQRGKYLIRLFNGSSLPDDYEFTLSFPQNISTSYTRIINLEENVSLLNSQLSETNSSLQSALASNTILTSQKASLDAQLATANSNISSLTSQLSTSTSRVSELESEINTLKSQTSNSSSSSNQTTNQNTSSTVEEAKKVASIKAYGLHAFLDVGSSTFGGKLYFTSYDGKSSWPLNDSNRVSGELKPLYSGSSSFVTDYLVANSYGIYEHGTVSLSISTADSDKNGVPDWLQKNMSVNEYISGNSQVHYLSSTAYGGDSSISGTFTRSAGLSSGNYNLNYTITGVGSAKATGVWYIGFYEGTVKYDNSIYEIDAQTLNSSGNKVTATGSSEYSISSSDNLNIGVLNLSYGSSTVQLQAGSLSRDGNTYSGFAKAVDGNTDTSWSDYVDWYIEITDPNDGDKDGVPDFTDPIQQAITPSSVDISGWNWHSWPWVYNHSIQNWLYYHKGASGYAVWNNSDRSWYGWNNVTGSWNKLSQ